MQLKAPINYTLKEWKDRGLFWQTNTGHHIFYQDIGDPQAAPESTVCLCHGFPESSYSYQRVIHRLLQKFDRIIAHDMIGYGFSDKPRMGFKYTIAGQTDVLLELLENRAIPGAHIISHDMGNSVATELAHRQNKDLFPAFFKKGIQSFCFTNGSVVLRFSNLRITQKLLLSSIGPLLSRITNYPLFRQQVKSAHGADDLTEGAIRDMWQQSKEQDGHHINHLLINYIRDRRLHETSRWLPAMRDIAVPLSICWGDADQVARIEMAHFLKKEICPQAHFKIMKGVGHFGQIASPDKWCKAVVGSL